MQKNKMLLIIGGILIIGVSFLLFSNPQPKTQEKKVESASEVLNAEKIEVIHFHSTKQCWSCITVGELALKTIEQEFPEEYEQGIVTFEDVNVDLAKNKELVSKYKARGSSLFVNAIVDGKDNIEEDFEVWRLLRDEEKYIEYLANKLNDLLGE